jgi:hypothetical protein
MGYHFSQQHRHELKRAPLDAEVQLTRWALIRNATPISGFRRLRDHADQVANISLGTVFAVASMVAATQQKYTRIQIAISHA